MHTFMTAARGFLRDEEGITAIEYGLIAAVMATAIATAFGDLKTGLTAAFTKIQATLSA